MSGVSGVSGSNLYSIQQYQQNLFNKIDTSGDGSISKSELETAVSNAGGTTQAADSLYAELDPNNTGSVSEQQFANALPGPPFSGAMQSQMLGFQAQGWPDSLSTDGTSSTSSTGSTATDPGSAMAQNLFSQIDSNGDGAITKTELEQAVTNAGGSTESADALYAKLDPDNTGSVSEQQFSQELGQLMPPPLGPPPGMGGCGAGNGAAAQSASTSSSASSTDSTSSTTSSSSTSSTTGETAQDAIAALLQELNSEMSTSGSGNSAQDAVLALLNGDSSSSSTSASGNSAQDALLALLQGTGNGTSSNSDASSAGSTTNSSALALAIQLYQAQISQQMGLFGTSSGA
jgi:Ca2+-binding EF-hand superfamily protein